MQFPLFIVALMALMMNLTFGTPITKEEYDLIVRGTHAHAEAHQIDFRGPHNLTDIIITEGVPSGKELLLRDTDTIISTLNVSTIANEEGINFIDSAQGIKYLPPLCNVQNLADAGTVAILEGIRYLQNKGDAVCWMGGGPGHCGRVSCSYDSGIFFCNDQCGQK